MIESEPDPPGEIDPTAPRSRPERGGEERGGGERGGPARGRRERGRRERRRKTRAALLDAAGRMWAERGIHGAALDDVAAAAGLTKGAVYSNFSGKTDLLLALVERHLDNDTDGDADTSTDTDGDGDTGGDAGRDHAERLGTDDARLLELLTVELWLYGMRDDVVGRRIADAYHERRTRLAEGLAEVGGASPADRAALAMAVDLGLAFQHLLDPDRVPAVLYASGLRLVLGPALR
ncbi:TetR/AcrR family transcriptional regulator [Actinomadura sp. HBU206391]|uniref:TetR/AcrR family transcriptional regulator n=1 Tax=Actinomadura sp. HBU206391 TaxID=2731692 RepID=UPI00164F01A6|nr:TetR/AcrR family transcriptional regulator [Actinomadura sp. HBU206391]MBC6456968.1 TetR/AcrR family transcriptional regulator [Actinomadura sp. HBU206391]